MIYMGFEHNIRDQPIIWLWNHVGDRQGVCC